MLETYSLESDDVLHLVRIQSEPEPEPESVPSDNVTMSPAANETLDQLNSSSLYNS